jgi:hypothetical protein
MKVGIIQWKYGARQTISLLFHPSGRKRLTEGSNVALHKEVGHTNNLKVGIYTFKYLTCVETHSSQKSLNYQSAAMPRMKK